MDIIFQIFKKLFSKTANKTHFSHSYLIYWNIDYFSDRFFKSIYILCLSVWVFVCSFVSKYVEMAEPIGLNVFVGPRMTPRKGNDDRIYQKFASIKMLFLKISKIHEIFFIKSAKSFVCSCFTMYIKRTFSQWK